MPIENQYTSIPSSEVVEEDEECILDPDGIEELEVEVEERPRQNRLSFSSKYGTNETGIWSFLAFFTSSRYHFPRLIFNLLWISALVAGLCVRFGPYMTHTDRPKQAKPYALKWLNNHTDEIEGGFKGVEQYLGKMPIWKYILDNQFEILQYISDEFPEKFDVFIEKWPTIKNVTAENWDFFTEQFPPEDVVQILTDSVHYVVDREDQLGHINAVTAEWLDTNKVPIHSASHWLADNFDTGLNWTSDHIDDISTIMTGLTQYAYVNIDFLDWIVVRAWTAGVEHWNVIVEQTVLAGEFLVNKQQEIKEAFAFFGERQDKLDKISKALIQFMDKNKVIFESASKWAVDHFDTGLDWTGDHIKGAVDILSGLTNYTYVNIEFLDWLAIKGYDTVVSNWDAVVQQTLLAGDFLVTKQQEIKDGIIYFESKEAVLSNITKPLVGFAHKNKEILNAAAQWTSDHFDTGLEWTSNHVEGAIDVLNGLTNYTYVNIEFLDWLAIKGYNTAVANWDVIIQQSIVAGDFLVKRQQEIKNSIVYFESKEDVLNNITKPLLGYARKNKEILNAAAHWTSDHFDTGLEWTSNHVEGAVDILNGLTNYTYVNIEFLDWLAIKGYNTVVANWDAVVQQSILAGDFLVIKQQEIKDGITYFESKGDILDHISTALFNFTTKNKAILESAAEWITEHFDSALNWTSSHIESGTTILTGLTQYANANIEFLDWMAIKAWDFSVANWEEIVKQTVLAGDIIATKQQEIKDGIDYLIQNEQKFLALSNFGAKLWEQNKKIFDEATQWGITHFDAGLSWTVDHLNDYSLKVINVVTQYTYDNFDLFEWSANQGFTYMTNHWNEVVNQTVTVAEFVSKNKEGVYFIPEFTDKMTPMVDDLYNRTNWPRIYAFLNETRKIISIVIKKDHLPSVFHWIVNSGFSIKDFFIGAHGGLKNFLSAIYDVTFNVYNIDIPAEMAKAIKGYGDIYEPSSKGHNTRDDVNKYMDDFIVNVVNDFITLWLNMRGPLKDSVIEHWESATVTTIVDFLSASGIDITQEIKNALPFGTKWIAGLIDLKHPRSLINAFVSIRKIDSKGTVTKAIIRQILKNWNFYDVNAQTYAYGCVMSAYADAFFRGVAPHLPKQPPVAAAA